MRRPLVAGNWKMNGDRSSAAALAGAVRAGVPAGEPSDVLVCPPCIHIPLVAEVLAGSAVALGAQNCSEQPAGAFTGEVAAGMLADYGCSHVIIGHSERRSIYGESDALAAEKVGVCLDRGLSPVLCVGESLMQRKAGETESVIARQLNPVLRLNADRNLEALVIAYEPVWAIGTGQTATPEQAQAAHAFVRERVAEHSRTLAEGVRILYGGSLKADNAAALFAMADVDGALVGGASLEAEQFLQIVRAAG